MPWKNGGGVTTEIAIGPEGAPLDAFDWRVSTAEVAADGPFSLFPQVDRTLCVLTGEGLRLAIGDAPPILLTRETLPFAFPADIPVRSWLVGGPVADLNIMTRRGRTAHEVRRRDLATGEALATDALPEAATGILFLASGSVEVAAGSDSFQLGEGDALVLTGSAPVPIHARRPSMLLVVEITPATG